MRPCRKDLPYLLFLQGGPGIEAGRPTETGGWISAATEKFRVILLVRPYVYACRTKLVLAMGGVKLS